MKESSGCGRTEGMQLGRKETWKLKIENYTLKKTSASRQALFLLLEATLACDLPPHILVENSGKFLRALYSGL